VVDIHQNITNIVSAGRNFENDQEETNSVSKPRLNQVMPKPSLNILTGAS